MAKVSRFWVFWIRNTMRKVTIVVPVLITSCQVSLNPNRGPVAAHTTMTAAAAVNADGLPMVRAVAFANRENHDLDLVGLIGALLTKRIAIIHPLSEVDMPSFDIVSEVNKVELKNAVDQANKEIANRFDFRGSDARLEQGEEG